MEEVNDHTIEINDKSLIATTDRYAGRLRDKTGAENKKREREEIESNRVGERLCLASQKGA